MTDYHPLSIIQAERLRIAADNNIRRESRRQGASLRRLLGHVTVLESLDDMKTNQRSNLPPSYDEAVSEPAPTSDLTTPDSDDTPELEEDVDANGESDEDDWWNDGEPALDDENDAEHALIKVQSHPPIYIQEDRLVKQTSTILDAVHWAELVSEVTSQPGNEPPVTESVVQVSEVED